LKNKYYFKNISQKIYKIKEMEIEEEKKENDQLQLLYKRKEIANSLYEKLDIKDRITMLKKILDLIETNEKFNYEYLKAISENKEEFHKYFNKVCYTLSDKHLRDLKLGIEDLKKAFISVIKEIISDDPNTELLNKYKALFGKKIRLNYPLIDCIEKTRFALYIYYLLKGRNKTSLSRLSDYIIFMEEDLKKINLDEEKLDEKIYLFMLYATFFKDRTAKKRINNFFLKGTSGEKVVKNAIFSSKESDFDLSIKKMDESHYEITNGKETKVIETKYYNIDGIEQDLKLDNGYPLEFILLRNESITKYVEQKECFLHKYKIYDSFIKYLKEFMRSKCVMEALDKDTRYAKIKNLIKDEQYLNEVLSPKHLKFMPFYYVEDFCGVTNKDFLISIINIIPRFCNSSGYLAEIEKKFNLLLLFSLGVMFISSLHEILIHLTFGYLTYYSNYNYGSISPKSQDFDDGGYYFENLLAGNAFKNIRLQMIITLFDGESCQKSLAEFQQKLNEKIDLEKLKKKQFKGFLGDYLKVLDIDFEKINSIILENLSIRGRSDSYSFLESLFISNPIPTTTTSFGGIDL